MPMTEKQRLIRKVQAATFALVEANLYLDSHPTCKDGLAYFKEHKKHYDQAVKEYEEKCGPLTAFNSDCEKKWEWVTTPFPWEREKYTIKPLNTANLKIYTRFLHVL